MVDFKAMADQAKEDRANGRYIRQAPSEFFGLFTSGEGWDDLMRPVADLDRAIKLARKEVRSGVFERVRVIDNQTAEIMFDSINEGNIIAENYFEVLAKPDLLPNQVGLVIMRSPFKGLPRGWKNVQALAPSSSLFSWYLKQRDKGAFWWPEYRDTFLRDLKTDVVRRGDDSKHSPARSLEIVSDAVKKGVTVRICCSCKDVDYCHRSLVKAILYKMAVDGLTVDQAVDTFGSPSFQVPMPDDETHPPTRA